MILSIPDSIILGLRIEETEKYLVIETGKKVGILYVSGMKVYQPEQLI